MITDPSNLSPTLQLAFDLIKRRSVTPEDAGCQQLMMDRLAKIGFNNEPLRFEEVDNFWSRRGTKHRLYVLLAILTLFQQVQKINGNTLRLSHALLIQTQKQACCLDVVQPT